MSSLLDRLKSRMGGLTKPLFNAYAKRERSSQAINSNRWDDAAWQVSRPSAPIDSLITDLSLGDAHQGGERESFDTAPELVRDLFMTFYKAAPVLLDKRQVKPEIYPARAIVEEMLGNPKLHELQAITAGDALMSTVAVEAIADNVKEIITRLPPPPPPPMPGGGGGQGQPQPGGEGGDQPGDQQGQQPDDGQPGDGGDQQPGEGGQPGDGQPGESDWDPDAPESQDELDWQAEYDNALDGLDLDRALDKALQAAQNEVGNLDDARRGIGLEDGEWQTMSPEERLLIAERLRTPEMQALASIVGRMKRFALGIKAQRVVDVPQEAYDVETGDDLVHVLNVEWGLLANNVSRFEFYRRYADKELLQFRLRGTEEVGKGPIVICVDKSGSMQGNRWNWAMGVCEALRRFAHDEGREIHVLIFGANGDRHRFHFPKGKAPFEQVLTMLSSAANGGTAFDGVLTEALQLASTAFDGEGKGKADIVFITDGQASLTDEWITDYVAERERIGVRQFGVYIGGARDMEGKAGPVGLMNRLCDTVLNVKDLNPAAAKDIFAQV